MKASDRIATMVHAFDDAERRQAVREIAERVKRLEATVQAARGLRWVHPIDRPRYETKFDEAIAALDEKCGS